MKSVSSWSLPSRSVIALWLLLALVLVQFGRLHQVEKRLNALTTPSATAPSEVSEVIESSSVSEDLLSFLDAFGAEKEVELREHANLEAAKTYFKGVDWAAQNLSLQNMEGVPVENGLSFDLGTEDAILIAFLLDHEGLFSIQTYRDDLEVEEPDSFESAQMALETYLKSEDFKADRAAATAVKTAEQNFSDQILGNDAVFAALQAKGMKLDYSQEDTDELRLVFTNVELTPIFQVSVQKEDAWVRAETLVGEKESLDLKGTDVDMAAFLAFLEGMDARPKVEQLVASREAELSALFEDDATQSVLNRHGLKLGERGEDLNFFIYPLLNGEGTMVAEILLERTTGDVKVRFDGQVWNLVEATESLQTLKKNS